MRKNKKQVVVHHDCRRKFTDTRVKEDLSGNARKKLRSSSLGVNDGANETIGFDWKSNCVFCSKLIDFKNIARSRVKEVHTLPIRESLIQKAEERKDDWGNQVLGRLLICNDLVAEEAVYHDNCRKMFTLNVPKSAKKGRPINYEMMEACEKLFNWLENESVYIEGAVRENARLQ